jgi:hypothetical protein
LYADHIHLFVGFRPSVLISDFVKEIKAESNEFIKQKKWFNGNFAWQEGYGVFSYGHSQIDRVCKYVLNQEEHHKKKTFKQEYLEFLEKFSIPFDEQYLLNGLKYRLLMLHKYTSFHDSIIMVLCFSLRLGSKNRLKTNTYLQNVKTALKL